MATNVVSGIASSQASFADPLRAVFDQTAGKRSAYAGLLFESDEDA